MSSGVMVLFVVISLVCAAAFGYGAWVLGRIIRRREYSVGMRIVAGVFLGVFGLIALACSACGFLSATRWTLRG